MVRFPQIQAEIWGVLLLGTGDIEDKISKDPGTRDRSHRKLHGDNRHGDQLEYYYNNSDEGQCCPGPARQWCWHKGIRFWKHFLK